MIHRDKVLRPFDIVVNVPEGQNTDIKKDVEEFLKEMDLEYDEAPNSTQTKLEWTFLPENLTKMLGKTGALSQILEVISFMREKGFDRRVGKEAENIFTKKDSTKNDG
ncbi:hypothetical protein J3458_012966 [Metarhizium acridum]|uniref:uncharacterized protein n=1 Tax=Metarhizium acridum TaxID=92637 RepID=UPI001C6C9AD2|nr:hypothetical protein J3458_012966 [Metarhizium acridum]